MDPFDMRLRARITDALTAVPTSPAPSAGRMVAAGRARRTRRRLVVMVGLVTLLLAGLVAAGLPSLGRGDYQSRLDAAGVPPGAEIIAVQARADGTIITVTYRDTEGRVHTIGGVERKSTPAP
ncbi:MAG: hypothetical protein LH650_16345 [Chloroflexi bacterium]|nr:hypothetical protein [Chloroflexota bacterium]